ncbi:hypothetical protein BD410DRAFT_809571 [Rickenella mellea]|uniref:Uncharacterized protein n=1 Tax=Rickenella mellea TaxID=50990 RepID=A0A4Y7PGU2_9AGAM|nr:hypothetical protein BD410DRAFT_809571 [Rickenella mellea]
MYEMRSLSKVSAGDLASNGTSWRLASQVAGRFRRPLLHVAPSQADSELPYSTQNLQLQRYLKIILLHALRTLGLHGSTVLSEAKPTHFGVWSYSVSKHASRGNRAATFGLTSISEARSRIRRVLHYTEEFSKRCARPFAARNYYSSLWTIHSIVCTNRCLLDLDF